MSNKRQRLLPMLTNVKHEPLIPLNHFKIYGRFGEKRRSLEKERNRSFSVTINCGFGPVNLIKTLFCLNLHKASTKAYD